jgi:Ni/Fe-hydrogenase subunit HybB-like protein
MFFFIALGTVLPMMHQSSLGSLLIVFGTQIHPLWQTMLLPLIFLLSAITIGYAVVLFESCLSAARLPALDRDAPAAPRWRRSCSACWRCSWPCASAT